MSVDNVCLDAHDPVMALKHTMEVEKPPKSHKTQWKYIWGENNGTKQLLKLQKSKHVKDCSETH